MALPFGIPNASRPTGTPAPSLPFGPPPSKANPMSATHMAQQGMRPSFYGGDEALAAERAADTTWERERAQMEANNEREFARTNEMVKERQSAFDEAEKERVSARDAEREREMAAASLAEATAPKSLTDSQRSDAEETAKKKSDEAKRSAIGSMQQALAPVAEQTEGGWFGIGAEPTNAAKDATAKIQALQAGEVADADLADFRKANPAVFAEVDKAQSVIARDDAARAARKPAEEALARAKAIKAGLSPEEADAQLASQKPFSPDANVANMQRIADGGLIEREVARVNDLASRIQSRHASLAQIDAESQEIESQLVRGGTSAQLAPLLARRHELISARRAEQTAIANESEAHAGAQRAITIREQRLKEAEATQNAQTSSESATGYLPAKDPVKATEEVRATKKAEAEKIITGLSDRAKQRADAKRHASEQIEAQVRTGKLTPEVGSKQRETAIEKAMQEFDAESKADQGTLEDSLNDYAAGTIDADTLNSIFHAAGASQTGVESFRENQAAIQKRTAIVDALEKAALGDDYGRSNPSFNGEEMKLLNEIANLQGDAANPERYTQMMRSYTADEFGGSSPIADTPEEQARQEANFSKQRQQQADEVKAKLREIREAGRAKLTAELVKRGVTDPAEQAKLIAETELKAAAKARPGFMDVVASRGGVVDATLQKLPFAGGVFEATHILPYAMTALALESGQTPPPEELEALAAFVRFSSESPTFIAKALDGITALPGFATELYATGGIATAVKKAGNEGLKAALTKMATAQGKEQLAKVMARSSADNVVGAWAKGNAKKALAYRIGSGFVQEAVRLAPASAGRMVGAFTKDSALQGVELSSVEGKLVATIGEDRRNTFGRMADTVVDSYIENLSERSGMYAVGALGKVTPAVIKDGLAKMGNAAKGGLMKAALVKSLIAKNPGIAPLKIQRFLKGANIGSTFEEMLEERVGTAARDVWAGVSKNEWGITMPSPEDLAVEMVTFMVPGAANAISTNRHFSGLDKAIAGSDAESTERINSIDLDPQAQAERLTKLGGTTFDAADITRASDLVGSIAGADSIRSSDKTQAEYMERANAAIESGDLDKGSKLMQMALQQSRTRSMLADQELGQAALAAAQIGKAREAGKAQADQLRAQAQAVLAADPKAKKQAEAMELQAATFETGADRVSALVKIARGRNDALTTAEKNALGDAVVNEGQGMIITDAAREEAEAIAPAAAAYIKQSETMRREQLSRDQAQAAGVAATASTPAPATPVASPAPAPVPTRGTSTQAGGVPSATGTVTAQGAATAPPAGAAPVGGKLPKDLAGANPRYNHGSKAFEVEFENDIDKAAYIAAQENPSKRDADYVAWAVQASGMTEQEVRDHGKKVRAKLKEIGAKSNSGKLKLKDQMPQAGNSQSPASQTPANPAPAPASAPATKPAVWKGVGVSGKTAEIPADEAATQDEAEKKLIKKLGEPLRSGGVTSPKGKGTTAAKPAASTPAAKPAAAPAPTAADKQADRLRTVGEQIDALLPSYRDAFTDVVEESGKGRRAWLNTKTGALHLNRQQFAAQSADLDDAALAAEIETIIRHEWIHAGTVAVRNDAQAAAFWEQLGKSKAGKDIQAAALRAYNAPYEARGAVPPSLTDAQSGYEAYRMLYELARDGKLSETTNIPESLAADIRSFLQGLVDWMRARLAKLPKKLRSQIERDIAEIEGALKKLTPAAPAAKAERPAPVDTEESPDLSIVRLKDGRLVHVRSKELAKTERPRLRMFTPEGSPIAGGVGVLERSDIDLSPVEDAPTVDAAAHEAATSPNNDKAPPTPDQAKAGNYEKGHFTLGGMDISIENPAGSVRHNLDIPRLRELAESAPDVVGNTIDSALDALDDNPAFAISALNAARKSAKGSLGDSLLLVLGNNPWAVKMKSHYGDIKGTEGKDGDNLDIFITEGTPKDYDGPVFVVNQMRVPASKEFDEHKAVTGIGITTEEEAKAEYLANYSEGWKGAGSIISFPNLAAFKSWAMEKKRVGELTQDAADSHSRAVSNDTKPTQESDQTGRPFDPVSQAPLPAAKVKELRDALDQARRWAGERMGVGFEMRIDDYERGSWTLQKHPSPADTLNDIKAEITKRKSKWAVNHVEELGRERTALVAVLRADSGVMDMLNNPSNSGLIHDYLGKKASDFFTDRLVKSSDLRQYGMIYDHFSNLIENPQWTESVARQIRKEEAAEKPAVSNDTSIKQGDRVQWTSEGETLTGTVRSTSSSYGTADVDTDQIALAGGVPIGRIETVQLRRLRKMEEKPAPKPKAAKPKAVPAPTAPKDAADEALAQAFEGLYAADRPVADVEQADLPKDRRAAMLNAAGVLIDAEVKRPEELAARLEKLAPGGQLRKYSRSFWRLMSGFDSALAENPDWNAIYDAIDNPATEEDTSSDETETDIRPQDSEASPPVGGSDTADGLGIPEPDQERAPNSGPENSDASGEGGDSPPLGERDGGQGLGDDKKPRKRKRAPRGGAGSSETADPIDGAGTSDVDGPTRSPGRENYFLSDPESIVGGGKKTRFKRNKLALETLEIIQDENRDPTPEELNILAAYTGWGSLSQELFQGGTFERHAGPQDWKDEAMWLRERLGKEAWMSAFDSIINAHYTDPPTVKAMWDMVRRMGFKGGRALEPSEGIGNFWSLMPRDMMAASMLTGIEMDSSTAAIAKMLHPQVNHRWMPYQQSQTSDNFYDLVIGNWPFSGTDKPADPRFDHLGATVHNFFFVKALHQTRPGGLVIGITSSKTMDGKSSLVRKYLAARGELVAAFRLPTGAFGNYAGTAVVTDIIILKKRDKTLERDAGGEGWINSVRDTAGRDFNINEYYVANPQNILGELSFGHGTTTGREDMIVNRLPNYEQVLPRLFERLPENVMTPWNPVGHERIINNTSKERRQGAAVFANDDLYIVDGESLVPLQDRAKWQTKTGSAKRLAEGVSLIAMRDAFNAVLDANRQGSDGETQRKALQDAYASFVKDHGPLHKSFMLGRFRKAGDQNAIDLLALVEVDETTGAEKPRSLMLRNTMRRTQLDAKGSIADAYALHRSETLDFDAAAVAKLAGDDTSPNDVIAFLQERNLVFKMPDGRWMPNEIYLAGNVRRKLREAIAAKEDGVEGMDANIDALTAIIPEDIPYHKITVQMGAAWIPTSDYEQFITELLGGNADDVQVVKGMSGYNVRIGGRTADSRDARQTWNVVNEAGQSLLHPSRMFQAAMNGTELIIKREVTDADGNKREEVDEPATRRAIAMRDSIRDRLQMWVWTDESRIARLTLDYNEMKNSVINPEFDGSHLRLPGLSLTLSDNGDPFEFRQHQVNAVWRGILQRQGVYAHEVGTGKTFTMAGLAIEGRRLGSHRKPIIFAHNANAASVAADFRLAYPGAKILFVDNLSPSTKELTLRQIATDEWDAIIVPHSLVDRFGLRPETMRALAQPELDRIESEFWAELDELGVDSSEIDLDDMRGMGQILNRLKGSATAKELANARRRIMTRIEKQVAKFSGPGVVFFEDMGIDAVIVDEAHVFKKISLATRKVIKGLNKTESGKGFQLGLLTDWLKTQTGGKGVHLFTGTPVTNTLNEVFNMMRFAMDKEMGESGIDNFDDWYNDYADGFSDTEPTSGGTYEEVTRLRGFLNVPELARLAGQAFDVVRADEMPEFKPRASHEGITEEPIGRPHKQVRPIVIEPTSVAKRLKAWIRQRFFYYRGLSGRERMFLKKMGGDQPVVMDGDGKAGALDPRFVSPTAEDDTNSKVNYAVRNIIEHYNEHDQATQMVFVERGAGDYTEADVAVRDAEGKPQYDNDGNRVEVKERRLQFNLLRDMVEKLVAQGVKPEEIAVFQNLKLLPLPDDKEDVLLRVRRVNGPEDKEDVAKLMREGKIRIAFGGTETMGTGVNAQTWMRAMHHLDVPYMPGDLEQRNGRGWRQGNKWNTVFEYRYTVEGSHDAKMWSTLLNKVRFIERFIGMLQGKNLSRNLEGDGADAADDEDGMSNADFEQMFSTAAGDPRLILRLSLGKKVDRIQQSKNMHLQFMEQTRRKNAAIENNEIPRLEAAQRMFEKGNELYQQVAGKEFSATLRGTTYTERKDFDEAMSRLPRYIDRSSIGTYGPFQIYIQPTMAGGYFELAGPDNFNASFMTPSMASLEGTLRGLKKKAENKAEEITALQKSLVRAKEEMSRPFPKEEELTKAQNALAVIEAEIRISPYPAPGWLRVGAPQGSLMYLKEKGKLNAYDVEAHRWDENNYWAMISRDGELFPIPYNEMLDATGARIFEDHDHTAPPEAPPTTADGQQGAFPGVEVGLDAEFGYRTLIDRVTGERSIEHKFYTRYATVADGFYNTAAGGGRLPANAADYLPKTVEELQRLLVRSGASSGLFNGKDWKFLAPGESDELYKPTETWRVFAPGGWMVGEGSSPREAFFEARNHDQNGDTFMEAIRYAVMQLPESEDDMNELLRIASQLPSGIEFQMIDPGLDDPFESENDDTNVFRLTSDGYGILGSGERRTFALREALMNERFGRTFKEALAIFNTPPAKDPMERMADESRLFDMDRRDRGAFRKRAKLRKLIETADRRIEEVESNAGKYRNRDSRDEQIQRLEARKKALTERLAEVESFMIYRERTEEPLPLSAADRPTMDAEEFAEALDALNSDMPSESDMDDLRQRAGLDWGREYTDSELAGLSGSMRAGMRTAYDDKLDRQTHEAWNEQAHDLIDKDPARVLADLVSTATERGSIINPVQVKASQILLPQLMREAIANRDTKSFRMAETLTWAYDAAGTETARGLAARWQPHLSPEERHREVLAKIIFTPGAKDREDIKRAPTDRAQAERVASLEKEIERIRSEAVDRERDMLRQVAGMTGDLREARRKDAVALRAEAKKELDALRAELKRVQAQKTQLQMLHDINTERLAKIEKAFEDMGITYHDLFISREISIGLKTSSVVKNAMQTFTPKERQALQMMMDGRSDRQIANKTGISRNSMAGLEARFDKILDASLESLVRRGFDVSKAEGLDVDKLIDKAGNILAAADRPVATLTADEIKKSVGELRAIIKPTTAARNSGALRRLKGEESKEAPYGFDISRPEHAAMLMRAIHRMDGTPMDMVYEYWINGLLSGPATHTANIAGNIGNAGLEYLIQRPIEALTNAVLFQNVAGASLGEYQSMTKYAARAASTAWRFARIAWNTEVSLFDSQWLNKPLVVSGNSGDKGQLERFSIPGATGRVVRTPTRVLQFADEWAKHFFGMIEAAAQAHRLAKADGLKPGTEAFDDRVEQLVGIPGSPAWLAAVDKAHRLTFTNDLPGPLAKAQEMLHSRAETPWGAVIKTLLRFVFPFVRTPYNIFATGLRKTPLGSARMIGKGIAAWNGKQPFFDSYPQAALAGDIAEQLIGWGAAMALWALGEGDPDDEKKTILITGSRSRTDDRGEDQLLDRLRGGETTILINGKPVFNYGRYEPFATIISTLVDASRDIKKIKGGQKPTKAIGEAMRGVLDQARTKTFLQGLDGLMQLIEGRTSTTMPEQLRKFIVTGIVPNLVRQPIRNADEFARDTRNAPWYYHAIPLGGLAEPLYDLYGRPVEKMGAPLTRALINTPVKPSTPANPADKALRAWNDAHPLRGDGDGMGYFPTNVDKSMMRYKDPSGKWQDMTPREAAELRRRGGIIMDAEARAAVTSPTNPTQDDIDRLKAARNKAFSKAKAEMFPGGSRPALPARRPPSLSEIFGQALRK